MSALAFEVEQALLLGAFNPQCLVMVEVDNLDPDTFEYVSDSVVERGCYRNAIVIGEMIGAEAVVFGAAYSECFGLAIEHAWIKLVDGSYCDPTYQSLKGGIDGFEYYKLIEIPIDEYAAESLRIFGGAKPRIINMHDLRINIKYRRMFQFDMMKKLTELRAKNESIA
ncbi:MAG: hypothetical protein ACRDCT_15100 [Shewanella sp.]